MKISNYTIGNRTRDPPACSVVPQPTASPAACPDVILTFLLYTFIVLEQEQNCMSQPIPAVRSSLVSAAVPFSSVCEIH